MTCTILLVLYLMIRGRRSVPTVGTVGRYSMSACTVRYGKVRYNIIGSTKSYILYTYESNESSGG